MAWIPGCMGLRLALIWQLLQDAPKAGHKGFFSTFQELKMFVGIQRGLELRGNSTKNSRFLFFSQKLLKSRFLRACLLQTRPFRMDGDSQLTIFESQIRMRDTTLRVRPSKKRARSSRRAFFPFSEEVDGSARAFLFSDSTTNRAGSVFLGKGGKF